MYMSELVTCGRCNRKLKTAKSISDGYGPVCKKKHAKEVLEVDLMDKRVKVLFGNERPAACLTSLKPHDLVEGDAVKVFTPFWWYDKLYEFEETFVIDKDQVGAGFEKYLKRVESK